MGMGPAAALHRFWFDNPELTSDYYEWLLTRHFLKPDPSRDAQCRSTFAPLLADLRFQSFSRCRRTPRGNLALILLLDQVPRIAFRGTPQAYAYDHLAQDLALRSLNTTFESRLSLPERIFLYLPLSHSENITHQHLAVERFEQLQRLVPEPLQPLTSVVVREAHEQRDTLLKYGHFPDRARADSTLQAPSATLRAERSRVP
jgi:uncharacterized protein (DUF924 family)